MHKPTHLMMVTCLLLVACTKKQPAVDPQASAVAAVDPLKTPHDQLPMVADANGEVRNAYEPDKRERYRLELLAAEEPSMQHLKTDLSKARTLFVTHCARCHGAEGRGDGPDFEKLGVAPTNFHEWPIRYGRRPIDLALSTMAGRNELQMPAFGAALPKEDFWSVVFLVSSWIEARPDAKAK